MSDSYGVPNEPEIQTISSARYTADYMYHIRLIIKQNYKLKPV